MTSKWCLIVKSQACGVTSLAGGRTVATQESKVKSHEAGNEQKNENEKTSMF